MGKPKNRTLTAFIQNITDNRTLWWTIVPHFRKKVSKGEKIILNETKKPISDDKKICIILNNLLSTIISDLKIPNHCNYFFAKKNILFSTIIETFEKHSSILNIKQRNLDPAFSFTKTTQEEILKVIWDLSLYRPIFQSYRKQSVDLQSKSTDWFLYDENIGR